MQHLVVSIWILHVINAKPLETGWHYRGPGEARAASHFASGSRGHATEPWSSQASRDWQILENDRTEGRMTGYNDRTGEVFNTAPGTRLASGIGCAGCLLFDLESCHVVSPTSFKAVPHSPEPYDRDRREQLWRIADAEGVRPGDLSPSFSQPHPPRATDEIWHVVSERDEGIDMTLFAWTEPGSIGSNSIARRLRCMTGWCMQFPVDTFLSSLLLIPLPAALLDAYNEAPQYQRAGCDRLSKTMSMQAQIRAKRIDPLVRSHGPPRSRILNMVKSAASDVIFAAEALAPLAGMVNIYAAAIARFTNSDLNNTSTRHGLVGVCDAPHNAMAANVLHNRGTSFTPEHINVSLPVRALGKFCRTMATCVLGQIRWLSEFASCLVGERQVNRYAQPELFYKASEGVNLMGTLLHHKTIQLSTSTGFSGDALADEIASASSDACMNVFHLAGAMLKITSIVFKHGWTDAKDPEDSKPTDVFAKFACCHKHASQINQSRFDCD